MRTPESSNSHKTSETHLGTPLLCGLILWEAMPLGPVSVIFLPRKWAIVYNRLIFKDGQMGGISLIPSETK